VIWGIIFVIVTGFLIILMIKINSIWQKIISYLDNLFKRYKDIIYTEGQRMRGFLVLLMKRRNTGIPWSKEEKQEIRNHLRHISKVVPLLIIFLLPGGTILLPVLAFFLDRRRNKRTVNNDLDDAGQYAGL
jgi:hypothetical protein